MPWYARLPRWARIAGRGLRVLAYMLVVVVAAGDSWWPSATIDGVVPTWQLAVTSGAMGALGAIGAGSVLLHRWRVEWVCAAVATFLLFGRAVPVWITVPDMPTRLAAAAMMTLAAVGLAFRALDLTLFHLETSGTARKARRKRRTRGARA